MDSVELASRIKDVEEKLQDPTYRFGSVDDICALLLPPLALLGLVDDASELRRKHAWPGHETEAAAVRDALLSSDVPALQTLILHHASLLPDWREQLEQAGLFELLVQRYFGLLPSQPGTEITQTVATSGLRSLNAFFSGDRAAGPAAGKGKARRLHPTSLDFALEASARLVCSYDLTTLHAHVVDPSRCRRDGSSGQKVPALDAEWRGLVELVILRLPLRAANACGKSAHDEASAIRGGVSLPAELERNAVLRRTCRDLGDLLHALAAASPSEAPALTVVIEALIRAGGFPVSTTSTSFQEEAARQTSFWPTYWPRLVADIVEPDDGSEARLAVLRSTLCDLGVDTSSGASSNFKAVAASLLGTCQAALLPHSRTWAFDVDHIEAVARILAASLGPSSAAATVSDLLLPLDGWSPALAAAAARWLSFRNDPSAEPMLLDLALRALSEFSVPQQVSAGRFDKQCFLATWVLLAPASAEPAARKRIAEALTVSNTFYSAVQGSLGAPREGFRLLGMLIAEQLSLWANDTPVEFGAEFWEGPGEAKDMCRALRSLLADWPPNDDATGWKDVLRSSVPTADIKHQIPAASKPVRAPQTIPESVPSPTKPKIEVIGGDEMAGSMSADDDDEFVPFAPSPEVVRRTAHAHKPTMEELETGEIGLHSLRPKRPRDPVYVHEVAEYLRDSENPERCAAGLSKAAEIVRRKAGWGTELEEHAIDLLFALTGLHDDFELPGFDQQRLSALTALVVCIPKKVAPALVERLFSQNPSVSQRSSMLNALAIGSRELAGLDIPEVEGVTKGAGDPNRAIKSTSASHLLPARLHDAMMRLQIDQPEDQLSAISGSVADQALTSAREDGERWIPGAAREKMLTLTGTTVRQSSSLDRPRPAKGSAATTCHLIAVDYFVMPLVNRMWLYLRDVASVGLGGGKGSFYQGTAGATMLDPLMLSQFARTLSVLIFPARNSPSFTTVLAPEVLALAITLQASSISSHSATDGTTAAALLELCLVVLDGCVGIDGGRSLTRSREGSRLVMEIQEWAQQAFTVEEERGGTLSRAGRAAAGLAIRAQQMAGQWQDRLAAAM